MPVTETQSDLSPPAVPPRVTTLAEWPEEIRLIGDQIAALTACQAKNLDRYLDSKIGKV